MLDDDDLAIRSGLGLWPSAFHHTAERRQIRRMMRSGDLVGRITGSHARRAEAIAAECFLELVRAVGDDRARAIWSDIAKKKPGGQAGPRNRRTKAIDEEIIADLDALRSRHPDKTERELLKSAADGAWDRHGSKAGSSSAEVLDRVRRKIRDRKEYGVPANEYGTLAAMLLGNKPKG
jgi:hypothetical protein